MNNDLVKSPQHITWPAIVKFPDEAELLYVNSQADWDSDTDLHTFHYDESDYLIDSIGNTFTLTTRINNVVQPESMSDTKSLDEILGLVKAHAAQTGACCVAKLYAPSIPDAFTMVKSLRGN